MSGECLGFLNGYAALDNQIDKCFADGVKVYLATRSLFRDAGRLEVLVHAARRVRGHVKERLLGDGGCVVLAGVVFCVEFRRFTRLGKQL